MLTKKFKDIFYTMHIIPCKMLFSIGCCGLLSDDPPVVSKVLSWDATSLLRSVYVENQTIEMISLLLHCSNFLNAGGKKTLCLMLPCLHLVFLTPPPPTATWLHRLLMHSIHPSYNILYCKQPNHPTLM